MMTLVSWSAKLRNGPIGCFSSVSSPPLSEKIIHFIIGVELIYSVVLVSDVQQSDSVMCVLFFRLFLLIKF